MTSGGRVKPSDARLLGDSRIKCLGKCLMEYFDEGKPKFSTYRRYLSSCIAMEHSGRKISTALDDSVIADFYALKRPSESPEYFDFTRYEDLSLLEEAAGKRFLVLQACRLKRWPEEKNRAAAGHRQPRFRRGAGAVRQPLDLKFVKLFDNSIFYGRDSEITTFWIHWTPPQLSGGGKRGRGGGGAQPAADGYYTLYVQPIGSHPPGPPDYEPSLYEREFFSEPGSPSQLPAVGIACFYLSLKSMLKKLTGRSQEEEEDGRGHDCSIFRGDCGRDWKSFFFSDDCLPLRSELTNLADGKGYVLVTLLGSPLSTKPLLWNYRRSAGHRFFALWASPIATAGGTTGRYVIALCADNSMYVPNSHLAEPFGLNLDLERRLKKSRQRRQAKKISPPRKRRRSSDDEECVEGSEEKGNECNCGPCLKAHDYARNMKRNGRQKIYRSELSSFDLIKILNLKGAAANGGEEAAAAAEKVLLEACRLSICSFDVETMTHSVNTEAEREEEGLIDGASRFTIAAVHEPIAIGVADELESEPIVISDFVGDEEESAAAAEADGGGGNLEKRFFRLLLKMKKRCEEAKKQLLAPYLEELRLYREAHFNFFADKENECTAARKIRRRRTFAAGGNPGPAPIEEIWNVDSAAGSDDNEDEAPSDDERRAFDCDALFEREMEWAAERSASSLPEEEADEEENAEARLDSLSKLEKRVSRKRRRAAARFSYQKELEAGWNNSLFGLLEKRLEKLQSRYVVFGFNAEKFDSVVLFGRLITAARQELGTAAEAEAEDEEECSLGGGEEEEDEDEEEEDGIGGGGEKPKKMLRPGRISIQRKGSAVKWIKFPGLNLMIAEIRGLLAPGINLDGLGRMCGLDVRKGIFPFAKLRGDSEFLKAERLPADPREWINDLDPRRSPSQSEINEALAAFERLGCRNVADYLKHYLKDDVRILQKAIGALGLAYFRILGLHFMDSHRFTISSFASYGMQTRLMRDRRPGMFFPNHTLLYAVS